jgi:hypothetical protein
VTPCVGGWVISTGGCIEPAPEAALSSEDKAIRDEEHSTVIGDMRAEGFSDEFVALFMYACENRVADDALRLVLALHRRGDDLVEGGLHAIELELAHGGENLGAFHHTALLRLS